MAAAEMYMRLALKSQSQCRATVETLAEIKNPSHVAFVRQANIANGPQQVNNGIAADAPRAVENVIQPSKLLEGERIGERMDTGAKSKAGGVIRNWEPWKRSTGPRTQAGKTTVGRNAYKGGVRARLRELRKLFKLLPE